VEWYPPVGPRRSVLRCLLLVSWVVRVLPHRMMVMLLLMLLLLLLLLLLVLLMVLLLLLLMLMVLLLLVLLMLLLLLLLALLMVLLLIALVLLVVMLRWGHVVLLIRRLVQFESLHPRYHMGKAAIVGRTRRCTHPGARRIHVRDRPAAILLLLLLLLLWLLLLLLLVVLDVSVVLRRLLLFKMVVVWVLPSPRQVGALLPLEMVLTQRGHGEEVTRRTGVRIVVDQGAEKVDVISPPGRHAAAPYPGERSLALRLEQRGRGVAYDAIKAAVPAVHDIAIY
jgi:hypothetical protein